MARPKTHYGEKREELVKVSFELFMKNGYESTSIQDIMNIAKISKGAMYHYFTSKEDILDAVLNYIIDMDIKRLEPILNDDSISSLKKLTIMMNHKNTQPVDIVKQATEYAIQRKESIFDYRARELSKHRTIILLTELIYEGVSNEEFHTEYPEEMAAFIYASSQTIGELMMKNTNKDSLSRTISAFVQLLTNCLGLKKKDQDFITEVFGDQFGLEYANNIEI